MDRTESKRPASRKTGAAGKLIAAAEQLFARFGIEAVSLRQIAVEAGCGNNNAVQYHFGDKHALIRAILESRLPWLDARRGELLAQLDQSSLGDPAAILRVQLKPIAELVDEDGMHRWAAFLAGLDYFEHNMQLRNNARELAPMTDYIMNLLAASLPHLSSDLLAQRHLAASQLFIRGLVMIDHAQSSINETTRQLLIDDYLSMAACALLAPVRAGLDILGEALP